MELLYEGKSKQVFATDDPDLVIVRFKDDATAFNGVKFARVGDKARINARISALLFGLMSQAGIEHHLVKVLNDTDHLCKRVEIVPVEVVVRNVVAGSLARRYGREEGEGLSSPIVEYFYKSDELNDPLMSDEVAITFGWATPDELTEMKMTARRVNMVLKQFWSDQGIVLVDFKLEFGRTAGGDLVLADELTPDGSRLWEVGTNRKFDKDVFRRDLGDLGDTYRELEKRVFG
jgi:phosphoribosylaminoimidazole-succinocarboxamide synthase